MPPRSKIRRPKNTLLKAGTTSDQPLFLRKTFAMITHADCWTPAGDCFIIKNPVHFAEAVIPGFFKHNNFSSFVRQLNFYGFKKVKWQGDVCGDSTFDTPVDTAVAPQHFKWWSFKHPNFQRGRPELLTEIKKAQLVAAHGIDDKGLAEMHTDVSRLKERMEGMAETIEELVGQVERLGGDTGGLGEEIGKRRRRDEYNVVVADSESAVAIQVLSTSSSVTTLRGATDSELLLEDAADDLTAQDVDDLLLCFAEEESVPAEEESVPVEEESVPAEESEAVATVGRTDVGPAPGHAGGLSPHEQALHLALSSLPAAMQMMVCASLVNNIEVLAGSLGGLGGLGPKARFGGNGRSCGEQSLGGKGAGGMQGVQVEA